MHYAIWEAITVAAMFACTEAWLVPVIQVRLGAAAHLIGFLTWVPQLAAMVIGPFAGRLIAGWGGARSTAIAAAWVQGGLTTLVAVPLLFEGWSGAPYLALALAAAAAIAGMICGIAWLSWMGDLVPEAVRGRYIGYRGRWFILTKLLFALFFMGVVKVFPYDPALAGSAGGIPPSPWGLFAIVIIGGAGRMVAAWLMGFQPAGRSRMKALPASHRTAAAGELGLSRFLRTMPATDLGRWTIVWATFNLGWFVAAPFFGAYMQASVEQGGLGLAGQPERYWLLLWTSTLVRLLMYPVAGRLVELVGPAAAMRLALPGMALLPLGWAASQDYSFLLVIEVGSGLVWSIGDCAIQAMFFGCHRDPAVRAKLIGFHAAVCSVALVVGTLIGQTLLAKRVLPPLNPADVGTFASLFILSGILRVPGVILAFRLLPRARRLDADDWRSLVERLPGGGWATEAWGEAADAVRPRRR